LTRAEESLQQAELLLAEVRKKPLFFFGAVGKPGTGKSLLARTLLTSQLARARDAYGSVDLASSRLSAKQQKEARDLYPTSSLAGWVHCTERPTLFMLSRKLKSGGRHSRAKLRVVKVNATPQQLRTRLETALETATNPAHQDELQKLLARLDAATPAANDAAAASASASASASVPALAPAAPRREVLYEGQHDNLWDDLAAADAAIRAHESTCAWSNDSLAYSRWSWIEYSGPWDGIAKDQRLVDLAGIRDGDRHSAAHLLRQRLSEEMGQRLNLIFLVLLNARSPVAEDVDLLRPFINRPIRDLPQVAFLYNPAMLSNWQQTVTAAGGLHQLYYPQPAAVDREACIAYVLRGCLKQASVDAKICDDLEGQHREYVFARLRDTQVLQVTPMASIFFTHDQQRQLAQASLWNAPDDAGVDSIWRRVQLAHEFYDHTRLLHVHGYLRSALANLSDSRNLFSRVGRTIQPKDAMECRKALAGLEHFNNDGWPWEQNELEELVEWETDQSACSELFDEIKQLLEQDDFKSGGFKALVQGGSDAAMGRRLRTLLQPVVIRRFHIACLEALTAVTWLLNQNPAKKIAPTDAALQIVYRKVDTDFSQAITDRSVLLEGEQGDPSSEAGAVSVDAIQPDDDRRRGEFSGTGRMNEEVLYKAQEDTLRWVSAQCVETCATVLDELCNSRALQAKLRKKAWEFWTKSANKLHSRLKAIDDDDERATQVLVQLDAVGVDLLLYLPRQQDSDVKSLVAMLHQKNGALRSLAKQALTRLSVELIDKTAQEELQELMVQVKTKQKELTVKESRADETIATSDNLPALAATVRLLTTTCNVKGAMGKLQPLPSRKPEALWQSEGNFTAAALPIQPLRNVPADSRLRLLPNAGGNGDLLASTWDRIRRRFFMQFKDDDPTTQRLNIYAHDGWRDELISCVQKAQADQTPGVSPIFIPSCDRAFVTRLAHLHQLREQRGLELVQHPETRVYVLVEPQDWTRYLDLFGELDFVTWVLLPANDHGVRFARACIVYLATCMRQAVLDQVDFSFFHQLDDDWLAPRIFDSESLTTSAMRPTTLFAVIRFIEHVLRHEVRSQDQRELLADADQLEARFPVMAALLNSTQEKLFSLCKSSPGDKQLPMKFGREFSNENAVRAIMASADRGALTPVMQRVSELVADFGDAFLAELQKMKLGHVQVCQAAVCRDAWTRRHNYNTHKIPANMPNRATNGFIAVAPAAAASAAAASVVPSPATCSSGSNAAAMSMETDLRFHYRYSTDRVGCHCHYLPTYLKERVNYLSDAQFFQSDEQLRQQPADFFLSDLNFGRDILAPRGLGGVLVFKVDMAYDRRKCSGGTTKFLRLAARASRAPQRHQRRPAAVHVEVEAETESDGEEAELSAGESPADDSGVAPMNIDED